MSDNPQPESETIADELRQLGQNLKEALRSAWESQERQKLQQEIQDGLSELGDTLSQAAQDFSSSRTGQALKEDLTDFQERWRTGDVENKVRNEIMGALKTVNQELKKATHPQSPPDEPGNP